MKKKKNELQAIIGSIDTLIELKVLIRKITPHYEMGDKRKKKLLSLLGTLQNSLQPLFSQYLGTKMRIEEKEPIKIQRKRIKKVLGKDNMALISSNSAKKVLKDLGIDPRKLIITGGPLYFEDYKKVNPQIPDTALEGIKKKCENLFQEIKNHDWKNKDLYFICEKGDISDELTLEKIDRLSELINKKIKVIKIDDWKDLEP
jgi:hypothetical protein